MANFFRSLIGDIERAVKENNKEKLRETRALLTYNRKKEMLINSLEIIGKSTNPETIVSRIILVNNLFNNLFGVLSKYSNKEEIALTDNLKKDFDKFLDNYLSHAFCLQMDVLFDKIIKMKDSPKKVKLASKIREQLVSLQSNKLCENNIISKLLQKLYSTLD